MSFRISPSIGVARLGSSHGQFCLSPDTIGGLPFEADPYGNKLGTVVNFKDDAGQVRRQGQLFKIFDGETELTLESEGIESIEWTVHLANKKAVWYQYSELEGNLLYGTDNSYTARNVELRNKNAANRQQLIVDPGPRTVSGARDSVSFDAASVPSTYEKASFPNPDVKHGTAVTTLGNLLTDDNGNLIVLGGFGHAGGDEPLTSYGGSDTWHDDISDGPVYCTITFSDGRSPVTLQAWVIVGSPDYAPEIVNISTLSDSMFDVAVRSEFNLVPDMCRDGVFNESYVANFQRDILPIMQRISRYQWVSNVQSMAAFFSNSFDFGNPEGDANARATYYSYFRAPDDKSNSSPDQPQQELFKTDGSDVFPMMPLNSGSNSVSNTTIVKFLSLNETQYFLLGQWAKGNFVNDPAFTPYPIPQADQASVGNCVGLPMCPGIEVTWSVQNKNIYSAPYIISDQRGKNGYNASGLSTSRDECEGGGCEPGDLTKRMACPWQADFFQCTIQYVNFTDPAINKVDSTPLPPTYYSYWWPPQSPWDVLTGELTAEGQAASHLPAGQQMNYARGINSFVQMVEHWSALAFIRNTNSEDQHYPYFMETERTNELFDFKEVPVSKISGNIADRDTTIPVFFLAKPEPRMAEKSDKAKKLVAFLEERSFKAIEIVAEGLGLPRSGTRIRR